VETFEGPVLKTKGISASDLPNCEGWVKELCHVALAKGSGVGAASLGFVSGLRKWVMIWKSFPKKR